jgi:hypothetical protein
MCGEMEMSNPKITSSEKSHFVHDATQRPCTQCGCFFGKHFLDMNLPKSSQNSINITVVPDQVFSPTKISSSVAAPKN